MAYPPVPIGAPAAGGPGSPPPAAPAQPLVVLTPEQLQALTQRGMVSPNVAQMYQNARIGPRPPQGLPGVPLPPAPASATPAAPAQARPPAPVAAPPGPQPQPAQEDPAAKAFVSLTDKLQWVPANEVPAGSANGMEAPYTKLSTAVRKEIEALYPEKKGQVPLGWNLKDLDEKEKVILAQLQLHAA